MSTARRKRDLAAAATRSSQRLNPGRHKYLLLSAIGQCLKAQYDTLAAYVPTRLAALIKQLEKQKRRPNWTCSFPASSFHEDAVL